MLLGGSFRMGVLSRHSGLGGIASRIDARSAGKNAISNSFVFGQSASFPQGYNNLKAIFMPIKTNGNMAVRFAGEGFTSFQAIGAGQMQTVMLGEGFFNPSAVAGANMTVTMQGEGFASFGASAIGNMRVTMDAGATPTAFDIAQETMASIIEAKLNLKDVLRIMLAHDAGKTDIDTTGANPVVKFKSQDGTKDRITGTMDGSERIDVDLDPT